MASSLAGLKYCHCTNPIFSFENARVEAAPVSDLGREVWICNRCDGIHHVRQIPVAIPRAPRKAITVLSEHARVDGVHELTFAMIGGGKQTVLTFQPYDRRPRTMGINPTDILMRTWERLDQFTYWLLTNTDADQMELMSNKVKARAYAEVLADMMPPFFTDADSIVREAVQRFNNRDNPDYETPGLGVKSLAKFDTTPDLSRKPSGPRPTGNRIPDTAVNMVKQALDTKMFTLQQICRNYEMTEAEVKEQLGLA